VRPVSRRGIATPPSGEARRWRMARRARGGRCRRV